MEIPRAAERNFLPQGSPAKSSSAIWGNAPTSVVVPANAGTHSHRALLPEEGVSHRVFSARPSTYGSRRSPGRQREDYRFALACSAELCAASASLAEISAVWAGLPQLGASLPSPQLRGR